MGIGVRWYKKAIEQNLSYLSIINPYFSIVVMVVAKQAQQPNQGSVLEKRRPSNNKSSPFESDPSDKKTRHNFYEERKTMTQIPRHQPLAKHIKARKNHVV